MVSGHHERRIVLMEKNFRAFMRARGLKLSGLKLPDALDAMSDFWSTETELKLVVR